MTYRELCNEFALMNVPIRPAHTAQADYMRV